jgi:RNA polymerase sigma-32 factor
MATSTNLQINQLAKPIGSLDAYIYWVNQIPMLSAEEEKALAFKFQCDGDLNAARKLIMSHLRFVVSVARKYMGYGLSHADLIQEGSIGLMKAVKRYDPAMGVRLVSFAVHWIKAEIHEFVLRNWRIVKIATTKAQRKLFFNLRQATKRLNWLSTGEIQAVAKKLNVNPKEVSTMESRLSGVDIPFEVLNEDGENDENSNDPANYLEATDMDPAMVLENSNWLEAREQNLSQALTALDMRSKDILQSRWLSDKKKTLFELAEKYHISQERVRQLEQNALQKLKVLLNRADKINNNDK